MRFLTRTPEQVRAESDPATYLSPIDADNSHTLQDPTYQLIQEVHSVSEIVPDKLEPHEHKPDPTTVQTPRAVANLTEATRRGIRASSTAQYTDEATRRFKIDLVQHKQALDGSSIDRVREEFRAYLRGLRLLDDRPDGRITIRGASARNHVCLVMDRVVIRMLADLDFGDVRDGYARLRGYTIRVVDAWWQRSLMDISHYEGVDFIPVYSLAYYYEELLGCASSGAMEDLWPFMKRIP
ncbi:uncharacterized protein DSM5745_10506 [Aspergillus mulundensis]|uniref:Uncharacterized protein n=1 Tax=Aspergillus mulundensis TaxID=1810919 RepID=A0A3D8QK75_9EURO|nr:hypothetical protein DSM5745_10506 [Aspergillus mulundensis]RDW61834.1 hypothetical protein DSM5745_10506 [Aspergillus mulundensis]